VLARLVGATDESWGDVVLVEYAHFAVSALWWKASVGKYNILDSLQLSDTFTDEVIVTSS